MRQRRAQTQIGLSTAQNYFVSFENAIPLFSAHKSAESKVAKAGF